MAALLLVAWLPPAVQAATVTPSTSDEVCNPERTIACSARSIVPDGDVLKFALSASTNVASPGTPKGTAAEITGLTIRGGVRGEAQQEIKGTPTTGTAAVARQVMLLLDTSQSMRERPPAPDRFAPEIKAAKTFVKLVGERSPDLQVGIVAFGTDVEIEQEPTTDPELLTQAIGRIARRDLTNDTDLYRAVSDSIKAMDPRSLRSILLITDGRYDPKGGRPSAEKLEKIRTKIKKDLAGTSSAKKDSIDLTGLLVGDGASKADIEAIGDAVQLPDTNLEQGFEDFVTRGADEQANLVSISVPIRSEWRGETVYLDLSAKANGIEFATSVEYPIPAAEKPTTAAGPVLLPVSGSRAIPYGVLIAALVAVFGALAILLTSATGALAGAEDKKSAVIRRLEIYSVAGTGKPTRVEVTEQTTRLGDSALTRSAVNLMSRFAKTSRLDNALDSQLEAAGLPLRTAEWMLLHIGIAVASALLLLLLSGGQIAAGILGLLLGIGAPWLFLTLARSRRESKFLAQLPDTLQLLAGSLAAGYSLPQAMDSVVRESHPPISLEFNRALVEARLGMLAEDALDGIAKRTGSKDFGWIVMAIRIQRDVGGNLAELLSSVAETLRERERLRRQVNALSAEGRLSGVILGALPLVFGLYLMLTRPDYIAPLFNTQMGLLFLAIGAILLAVGGFWMSKVIKVKV